MFNGNYRCLYSMNHLSNLIIFYLPEVWKSLSTHKVREIKFCSSIIKTRQGFFQLSVKKEITAITDEKVHEVVCFTVTKIKESNNFIAYTPIEGVRRFNIQNFDNEEALLREIDTIFRQSFLTDAAFYHS